MLASPTHLESQPVILAVLIGETLLKNYVLARYLQAFDIGDWPVVVNSLVNSGLRNAAKKMKLTKDLDSQQASIYMEVNQDCLNKRQRQVEDRQTTAKKQRAKLEPVKPIDV